MGFTRSQIKKNTIGPTPGTAVAVTLDSSTTSGRAVVVRVAVFNGHVTSVTDNKGNTFTKIGEKINAPLNKYVTIWLAYNITGGASHQITMNQPTNNGLDYIIEEWNGVGTLSPFDKNADATGTGFSPSSGNTATTSTPNQLVLGTMFSDGFDTNFDSYPISAGSGFSNYEAHVPAAGQILSSESKEVSATGAQAATFTIGTGSGVSSTPGWAIIVSTLNASRIKTHTTDAMKHVRPTRTHTTDANKRRATLRTHTTSAFIGFQRRHTTDALKRKNFTLAHITDGFKKNVLIRLHTTDARIVRRSTKTHTVDALKRISPTRQHTTDAHIRLLRRVKPIIQSVTANKPPFKGAGNDKPRMRR